MATADFIPAGRTARVKQGPHELQIQTEYANRPNPRLTTSVISGGQVIHKIQQDLAAPISSLEEMSKVETMLRKQHLEVMDIVSRRDFSKDLTVKEKPRIKARSLSLAKRLASISGVENVFHVNNDGRFESSGVSEEFKKRYAPIFKSLYEVLDIFSQLPGGKREKGVCEIEPNRLYLASTGLECYFLLTRRVIRDTDMESEIQAALDK
ncbi:MAG: hypothetical protein JSU69_02820 [Candidatus Zixiibacteriota bacterium]|nr:MAG: hypothetical protein JSU69_02820 [candidate division Zixibacteria bacterium]